MRAHPSIGVALLPRILEEPAPGVCPLACGECTRPVSSGAGLSSERASEAPFRPAFPGSLGLPYRFAMRGAATAAWANGME